MPRLIAAPSAGLKGMQSKLSNALQDMYVAKKSVHGFVRGKTILTGAINHSRFQVQSATPSPWVLASSKKTS